MATGKKKKAPAKKKAVAAKKAAPKKAATKKAAVKKKASPAPAKKSAAKKPAAKKAPAKKAAVKQTAPQKPASKAPAKKAAAAKAARKASAPASKRAAAPATPKKTTAPKQAVSGARKAQSTITQGTPARKPVSTSPARATVKNPMDIPAPKPGTLIHGYPPYMPKKGEEYMSDEQYEHFRKILNAWRQELMLEADRTMHHLQDEASNLPDPNDRATQEEEFALELRTRDRERKLLKKIEKALDKIDEGEYGYCEACGIEVGIRRLEARPTAELCIDCKELAEIKERQLAG